VKRLLGEARKIDYEDKAESFGVPSFFDNGDDVEILEAVKVKLQSTDSR